MVDKSVMHSSHWGSFRAIVRDGRLIGVKPFERDSNPSDITEAILDAPYADCRIARPSVRKGWLERGPEAGAIRGAEPFVEVPWDEALDIASGELRRIMDETGPSGIFGGSYGWSSAGRFHHAKTQLQRFLSCLGGYVGQTQTYSTAAGSVLLPHILGDGEACTGRVTDWRSIAAHTELFVAFGGLGEKNHQIAAGGPGTHEIPDFIQQARANGMRFVNVSPLRNDAAEDLSADWIPIRPNADTAFILGLCHTLIVEGLSDEKFCQRYCVGTDIFSAYVTGETDGQPKDADWASKITGVDADRIRRLARLMASKRTFVTTAWALQRAEFGEQSFWATVALGVLLGQVGLPGGGFSFGLGSMGGMGVPRLPIKSPALPCPANPHGQTIPVARIADMLLAPGGAYEFNGERRNYPDIRMIYWAGGNPFHHHQDINRLVRAFQKPETIIVNEPWWTSTARMADIVFPTTTTLERNDVAAAGRDRFIVAMKQAIDPVDHARHDHHVFRGLAHRLNIEEKFTEGRSESEWLERIYTETRDEAKRKLGIDLPMFEAFWEREHVEIPPPAEPYDIFAGFRADPASNPLKTASGKIEIHSSTIAGFGYDSCPGHPVWIEPKEWLGSARSERYPLHMISNQPRKRLHSQLAFAKPSVSERIGALEPVRISPQDAAARNLSNGDPIRVFNDRGETRGAAVICESVMPGVIVFPTGAWYAPERFGTAGSPDLGGNPNVLTRDVGTSALGQGPSAHSALVEVAALETALSGTPGTTPELLKP